MEACTVTRTTRRPLSSVSCAVNEPSNTLAVPLRVNGSGSTPPTPGVSTKIAGSKLRNDARR